MRPAGLLGVLIVARLLARPGIAQPVSVWTPIAYLWQDVAVVLAFAMVEYIVRRKWCGRTVYAFIVGYVALNVPIARVLSTPLTLPMIRAAGGPLVDSIKYYLTPTNVGMIAITLVAGILLPIVLSPWKPLNRQTVLGLVLASVAVVASGPYAVAKVDTSGRYRNAIGALWPPRVLRASDARNKDWRASPFPSSSNAHNQLLRYRGAAAGRNVVLVALESTAARYWPSRSSFMDPMPNLTALASDAISFEHAYAVYPESIKGLFSVLCSRYPAFDVAPEAYSRSTCPSLPDQFVNAGYRTALFHSGRFMYLGMSAVIEKRGFEVLEDAGAIGGNIHSSFGVDDSSTVKRLLSWIDSLKEGERFFVMYLPVAGHHPYAIPERGRFSSAGRHDEFDRYLDALHYGDRALGELLNGLRARSLDRNTLFVLFGDHGEAFGQHDGNFGHTLFIYDENVRVPYIIAAPGLIEDKISIPTAASLIDTAPTILDLLGLPSPAGFQGASLLDSNPRMSLFFTDYSLGWLGLYDKCRKYLFEINSRRSKLYDVCKDPDETHDLSEHEPDRVSAYRSILEDWIAAQGLVH
jgi:hypothetical protein